MCPSRTYVLLDTTAPLTCPRLYAPRPAQTAEPQTVPAGFSPVSHPNTSVSIPDLPGYDDAFGEVPASLSSVPGDLPAYDDITTAMPPVPRHQVHVPEQPASGPPPAYE